MVLQPLCLFGCINNIYIYTPTGKNEKKISIDGICQNNEGSAYGEKPQGKTIRDEKIHSHTHTHSYIILVNTQIDLYGSYPRLDSEGGGIFFSLILSYRRISGPPLSRSILRNYGGFHFVPCQKKLLKCTQNQISFKQTLVIYFVEYPVEFFE